MFENAHPSNLLKIAWTKASQVWITVIKTNEYERMMFTDQMDYHTFGISLPDLVGYECGQPITLPDRTKLVLYDTIIKKIGQNSFFIILYI